MGLLISGVVLWSVMHFLPAGARSLRANMVSTVGEGPWKGLVTMALLISVGLMVMGWRSIDPEPVYAPPAWSLHVTPLLMFFAVVLFGAANAKSNIKRVLRNPMLTGMIVWAAAHLLANGDDRSVVLFGGLGLWAIIMIPFINRRDGAWEKPAPFPFRGEIILAVISVVVYVVLVIAHPYFAGVNPIKM